MEAGEAGKNTENVPGHVEVASKHPSGNVTVQGITRSTELTHFKNVLMWVYTAYRCYSIFYRQTLFPVTKGLMTVLTKKIYGNLF